MTVQFSGAMSSKMALWFNKLKEDVASYIPGEKATCPLCGSASPVTSTLNRKHGIRSHKCPACGHNFRSSEVKNRIPEEVPKITPNPKVVYVKGQMTKCPKCDTPSPVNKIINNKKRIRSHKCPNCKNLFKSYEK